MPSDAERESDPTRGEQPIVARGKVYGTPRVFDLFTMLAVTLAFAMLVASTNLLFGETSKAATVVIALYVTLIGLSQAILFNGDEPRIASLISGPVVMSALFGGFALFNQGRWGTEAIAMSVCTSVTLGFPAGYLAGAVVAGVFLVADTLRKRPLLNATLRDNGHNDVRFDDVE